MRTQRDAILARVHVRLASGVTQCLAKLRLRGLQECRTEIAHTVRVARVRHRRHEVKFTCGRLDDVLWGDQHALCAAVGCNKGCNKAATRVVTRVLRRVLTRVVTRVLRRVLRKGL